MRGGHPKNGVPLLTHSPNASAVSSETSNSCKATELKASDETKTEVNTIPTVNHKPAKKETKAPARPNLLWIMRGAILFFLMLFIYFIYIYI